jgi:hypothetical protein
MSESTSTSHVYRRLMTISGAGCAMAPSASEKSSRKSIHRNVNLAIPNSGNDIPVPAEASTSHGYCLIIFSD